MFHLCFNHAAAQVEEARRRKEDEKRRQMLEDNKYLADVRCWVDVPDVCAGVRRQCDSGPCVVA